MQMKMKVVLVTVVFALAGFMLQAGNPDSPGAKLWEQTRQSPAPANEEGPPASLTPLLIFVAVVEAIAFGLGIAFLAFGYALVKRAGASPAMTTAAFFAIAWGLVSWVPHTAMHITNGAADWERLVLIEYIFHVTLIASAVIVARFFLSALSAKPAPAADVARASSVALVGK